jgi:hypothetical protein
MGMPSAYWPGLSWGTRPTQLGVTGSLFGSCLPSFVRLGAVAVAVGIGAPQWWGIHWYDNYLIDDFNTQAAIPLESSGTFNLTTW